MDIVGLVGGGRTSLSGDEVDDGDMRVGRQDANMAQASRPRSGSCRWIRKYPHQSSAQERAPCSMPSHDVAKERPGLP